MRKRPVADLTNVSESTIKAKHLNRNHSRFTIHQSETVPGKKSATPKPKDHKGLQRGCDLEQCQERPAVFQKRPFQNFRFRLGMSKGATPIVPGKYQ